MVGPYTNAELYKMMEDEDVLRMEMGKVLNKVKPRPPLPH